MGKLSGTRARTHHKVSAVVMLLALVGLGLANAVALYVIEEFGNVFVPFLYNDVLEVGTHPAIMFLTLIVFGLLYFLTMRLVKFDRQTPPTYDLLSNTFDASSALKAISVTLAVGLTSLLAGAALGPGAMLMGIAASLGAFVADKWTSLPDGRVWLIAASLGGLLAPFGGSLVFMAVPIAVLIGITVKRPHGKRAQFLTGGILCSIVTTVCAFQFHSAIEELFQDASHTPLSVHAMDLASLFGQIKGGDYVVAVIVGVIAVGLVQIQQLVITASHWLSRIVIGRNSSFARGALFAVLAASVIAAVYWFAGPTVMFSGRDGTGELAQIASTTSVWTIMGLLFAKLLVSAWSKGTGYYGGLIFPAIYAGVALGIITSHMTGGQFMAGATIGALTGMAGAAIDNTRIKGPLMGAFFVIGVLPFGQLTALALCGTIGSLLGQVVKKMVTPRPVKP